MRCYVPMTATLASGERTIIKSGGMTWDFDIERVDMSDDVDVSLLLHHPELSVGCEPAVCIFHHQSNAESQRHLFARGRGHIPRGKDIEFDLENTGKDSIKVKLGVVGYATCPNGEFKFKTPSERRRLMKEIKNSPEGKKAIIYIRKHAKRREKR